MMEKVYHTPGKKPAFGVKCGFFGAKCVVSIENSVKVLYNGTEHPRMEDRLC